MASGSGDLIIACECGGGICTVSPLLFNPQCLLVCCPRPRGPADGGGCGFMQWRDTNNNNITTWHSHHNFPPPPPLFTATATATATATVTDTTAEEYTYTPPFDTPTPTPTPTLASQDVPPPPPPPPTMMCPCGAGPCSIGTAKNARNFYSCPACKFRKWCDAGLSSECYICREEGHWSMDCPRLPPSVVSAAASNKKICFYCKLEDHYASDCPRKSRRRRN